MSERMTPALDGERGHCNGLDTIRSERNRVGSKKYW